jgi:hypothetical protein
MLFLLCLLALPCAASVSAWAAPTITGMTVMRGRDTGPEAAVSYHEWVILFVNDPGGPADIGSVAVMDTLGQWHDAALKNWQDSSGEFWWQLYGQETPPPPGSYVGQVTDQGGQVTDEASAAVSAIPEDTPVILTPDANYAVTSSTPTFSWSAPEDVGCFCLGIGEVNGPCAVWCAWRPAEPVTSPLLYNYNGTGADLVPGHLYSWYVNYHVVDPAEQTDPRAWVEFQPTANGYFYVDWSAPVIQNVWIIPYHTVSPDNEFWSECAQITAFDRCGYGDIAAITTVNPNGDPRPGAEGCSSVSNDGLCTLYQGWGEWEMETTRISPGAYTVTAQDNAGHTSASVSASFVEWPPMQDITYPEEGSVLAETVPVFTWESVPDAYQFDIWLLEQGPDGYSTVWRQFGITAGSISIVYNDDGTATASELTPGKHYELRLSAFHPDQDPSDQASVMPVTERAIRFWVEPKLVGFLEPINNDGSSIFKLKSTVPVKFRLLNADGSYKSDAVATLSVRKVENDIVGTYAEAVSTDAPDSGNAFHYVGDHYQFNLATKGLSSGTWRLQVAVNGVVAKEVLISLK